MDTIEYLSVIHLTKSGGCQVETAVAQEYPATIFLNGEEIATLFCSPKGLDYLAAGFLFSEGLIKGKGDIKKIEVDSEQGVVRVKTQSAVKPGAGYASPRLITSSGGGLSTFYKIRDAELPTIESRLKIRASDVFHLVKSFQYRSKTYLTTRGTHSAALSDQGGILVFSEDIGRHNAVDKLFGQCLLEDIPTEDRIVLTSGRISFEILYKVSKRAVPIIISISAPMSLGIKIAEKIGVTLIGSVRGRQLKVYSHPQRVIIDASKS